MRRNLNVMKKTAEKKSVFFLVFTQFFSELSKIQGNYNEITFKKL